MEREKLLSNTKRFSIIILAILYIVGTFLHIYPPTRNFVLAITPLFLIFTFGLLIWSSEIHKNISLVKTLIIIALIGYFFEWLGVSFGIGFGEYTYGETLGIKLLGVPLVISINWAFVIFGGYCVARILYKNDLIIVLVAPILIVIFDIIMEPVAIELDYWSWENVFVPISNYLTWYLISLISVVLLVRLDSRSKISYVNIQNPAYLFGLQLLFFFMIGIF